MNVSQLWLKCGHSKLIACVSSNLLTYLFPDQFSPACQHSQVAVWSNGVFQATFPAALEEHHVPQEKQGGHIFNSHTKVKKSLLL